MNHPDLENVFPDVFPCAARQERNAVRSLGEKGLRRDLRARLLGLPYRSFLIVIAQLLEKQGSRNVHLLGRDRFVGRNRGGGWDLEVSLPAAPHFESGQPMVQCIIQVKQFNELAVQQRTVDELRGCCLRAGAGQGMIVTTSRFSRVARQAAAASVLAPILLIDGETLVDLLARQGMGVVQSKGGKWQLDPEFFLSLSAKADALLSRAKSPVTSGSSQAHGDKHRSLHSRSSRVSVVAKENQSPQTVLHFSVTLGAGESDTEAHTKAK